MYIYIYIYTHSKYKDSYGHYNKLTMHFKSAFCVYCVHVSDFIYNIFHFLLKLLYLSIEQNVINIRIKFDQEYSFHSYTFIII